MEITLPYFNSDNGILNRASRIATGDIMGNCVPFCDGLLRERKTCLMAGLDYDTPWTRDTSVNAMNYMSIAAPEIAENTLLSVCETVDGKKRIGGQYWDAIIWALAAWQHYLINRDRDFLVFSHDVVKNSFDRFENEEFDPDMGLFRGPAVYGDGIAAYPDRYVDIKNHYTDIMAYVQYKPELKAGCGFGIPMFALSTNCVYYAAYRALGMMGMVLNNDPGDCYGKSESLMQSIQKHFRNEKTGMLNYLCDNFGGCDREEALGLSFAILFGVADEEQTRAIAEKSYVTAHGKPCLWPSYERYRIGNEYGRHSGTVWPHAQGYWALAMLKAGYPEKFETELFAMAYKAVRDMHFAELYHPVTGEIYGGMQENLNKGITVWKSCDRQSWSATAFRALLIYGIVGLKYTDRGAEIKPNLPGGMSHAEIDNLRIFGQPVRIIIDRDADAPKSCLTEAGNSVNKTIILSC